MILLRIVVFGSSICLFGIMLVLFKRHEFQDKLQNITSWDSAMPSSGEAGFSIVYWGHWTHSIWFGILPSKNQFF